MNELKETFTTIYDTNWWQCTESRSGGGSTLNGTEVLRNELMYMFKKYNILSILDLPCGDFNWMKEVDLTGINYIGADIVDDLIKSNQEKYTDRVFKILDITKNDLPQVDLIFVRDCFGHMSQENVFKALENIKLSNSKYLLTTSFTKFNSNPIIGNGDWGCLNLMLEPFFLNPIYLINEDCKEGYPNYNDKCMLLFDLTKFENLKKDAKTTPQAYCIPIPKK